MSDPEQLVTVALAFPLADGDRIRLRQRVGHPLPAIYPNSIALPCANCEMQLAVGPRTVERMRENDSIILLCPTCLSKGIVAALPMRVESLENPDSKWEKS